MTMVHKFDQTFCQCHSQGIGALAVSWPGHPLKNFHAFKIKVAFPVLRYGSGLSSLQLPIFLVITSINVWLNIVLNIITSL